MTVKSTGQAVAEALALAMEMDEDVFLAGQRHCGDRLAGGGDLADLDRERGDDAVGVRAEHPVVALIARQFQLLLGL